MIPPSSPQTPPPPRSTPPLSPRNSLLSIEVRGFNSHSNPKSRFASSSHETLFPVFSTENTCRRFAKNDKWSRHAELDRVNGAGDGSGGNGDGGGDDGEHDTEEAEFGPLSKFEEVIRELEAREATLPSSSLTCWRWRKLWGSEEIFSLDTWTYRRRLGHWVL
ncbi:uncharacterized protein LOC113460985 isoform X2 [Phoenix dactylifera]|uniref:Uncharacterized protein LOC113460985 isoform X2 n=1 Tax=Phoenix dactylifera TaxID=42345 RepID=A0A8B8IZE2_PHODC|nr:uncharacterized protein LOC113460985 isoform X2 [Phoenix dactylifera]